MCVNGEEMLLIDRFIIDMGLLSYPADFPVGNLHAISTTPPELLNLGT